MAVWVGPLLVGFNVVVLAVGASREGMKGGEDAGDILRERQLLGEDGGRF